MKKIYFTITGTKYRCGHDFMKPGMKVKLVKEPDNAYDTGAIKVMMKGVGIVGYVANSVYTVKGESWNADTETKNADTETKNADTDKEIDYAFFCCDGVYNMDLEEAAQCAELVGAKHSIPYHMTAADSQALFDRSRAEQFDVPDLLIIEDGQEIDLE